MKLKIESQDNDDWKEQCEKELKFLRFWFYLFSLKISKYK